MVTVAQSVSDIRRVGSSVPGMDLILPGRGLQSSPKLREGSKHFSPQTEELVSHSGTSTAPRHHIHSVFYCFHNLKLVRSDVVRSYHKKEHLKQSNKKRHSYARHAVGARRDI